MIKTTLLFFDQNTCDATIKVLEILFKKSEFSLLVCLAPKIPVEVDDGKFLVSEAMKIACNKNEQVFIIGLKHTIINCSRFQALVKHFPYPIDLTWLIAEILNGEKQIIPICENKCSAFGNEGFQIYAEEFIKKKLCHDIISKINNYVFKNYNLDNANDFNKATNKISIFINSLQYFEIFPKLFVPVTETETVNTLISVSDNLKRICESKKADEFNKEDIEIFRIEYEKFFNAFMPVCRSKRVIKK